MSETLCVPTQLHERTAVKDYAVVDIFCGIGGLTHGFVLEDFNVIAGLDSDETCQYAYEQNNNGAKFVPKKIEDVVSGEVANLYPEGVKRILVGCAPCQPFSSNNTKRPETDKWKLLDAFADLVEEVKPDVWSMENVLQLKSYKNGSVFNDFVERLKKIGYFTTDFRAYCPEYGVPQKRRRLVMFGSKFGEVELLPGAYTPNNFKTVRQTIGNLNKISAGEFNDIDELHTSSGLSKVNLTRIRASKPGGSWEEWDDELILRCHRNGKGKTAKSVYGRMVWDEPSPTLTTQFYNLGSGRYGHPEQDRAISLREGALLQTFPINYKFTKTEKDINFTRLGRQIGNAVPVELGRVVAKSIKRHFAIYLS